ncbi:MAG: hypothetical protein ACYTFX_10210 [Planctomycetota bacterium]
MDAAVRLVIVDTQQAIAVGEIASSTCGGCFQFFCHEHSFRGNFPHRSQTDGQFRTAATGLTTLLLYHRFVQTVQTFCGEQSGNGFFCELQEFLGRI